MSVLFFNAGDKIDEVIPYSIPNGQDVHVIARWNMIAPKEDVFEVPTEIEIAATGESVSVQFAKDISRKFGARGVVKIDAGYDPEKEDPEQSIAKYPFARTLAEAEVRGREIWQEYLRAVVESHLQDCEAARAAGGAPRSAVGFTKRAMKALGIQDPGEQYFKSLQHGGAGEDSASSGRKDPAVAALQAQLATLTDLLVKVAAGKQIDAEALAQVGKPAVGASESGQAVTSGVATGDIKKPLGNGNYETAKHEPRSKSERRQAAAEQLQGD